MMATFLKQLTINTMNLDLIKLMPEEFCAATKPCYDVKSFALERTTMAQVWDECQRGDWLLWILAKLDYERKPLVAILCDLVRQTPISDGRTVEAVMPEEIREALKVVERWAAGNATDAELLEAKYAANAAAAAASAAAYASSAAAYASSAAAYDASYASACASQAAKKWQADYIRDNVPNPFSQNN